MGPPVPGDIPWSLVRLWARDHGMTRGEFALLDRVIQAMDAVHRSWWISKQPIPDKTRGDKWADSPNG